MRKFGTIFGDGMKDLKKEVKVKMYDRNIAGTLRIEFDTPQPKASVSMLADMVVETIDDWQDLCVALCDNTERKTDKQL